MNNFQLKDWRLNPFGIFVICLYVVLFFVIFWLPTRSLPAPECSSKNVPLSVACSAIASLDEGAYQTALNSLIRAAQPKTKHPGDPEAQYVLAYFYQNGYAGLTPFPDAAKVWIGLSSQNGYPLAKKFTHLLWLPLAPLGVLFAFFGSRRMARNLEKNLLNKLQLFDPSQRAHGAYFATPGIWAAVLTFWARNGYFTGNGWLSLTCLVVTGALLGEVLKELARKSSQEYLKSEANK